MPDENGEIRLGWVASTFLIQANSRVSRVLRKGVKKFTAPAVLDYHAY